MVMEKNDERGTRECERLPSRDKMINWQFLVASIARAHHIYRKRVFYVALCVTQQEACCIYGYGMRGWIERRINGMYVHWNGLMEDYFLCVRAERDLKEGQSADIEPFGYFLKVFSY